MNLSKILLVRRLLVILFHGKKLVSHLRRISRDVNAIQRFIIKENFLFLEDVLCLIESVRLESAQIK
jgi:hypothetical protein